MNRNVLYMIIGALAVVTCVIGYQLYERTRQPTGVEISIGGSGIKIEPK